MNSGKCFCGNCARRLALLATAAFLFPIHLFGQSTALDDLPDAPQPLAQQTAPATTQSQPAGQTQQQPGSPSSAQPAQQTPETKEEKQERARRELEQEEKQRMLGVVPMFNVQSNRNAAPLTSKQKFQLFFRGSTDWYQFAITGIDGEISLLGQEYPSYGEGVEGFAKYWGAAYADTFDGNLWGNAILTSWWHEDPRYFRMGEGNFFKRAGYSAMTTIWCRRDNGKWGPNYANVTGNFIGGAISNLYYPASDRGVELTFARGASVTYEGIVGAELAEFWPDIARHLLKKHLAKQAAEQNKPTTTTKQQPEGTPTPPPNPQDQKPQ